MTQEELDAIPEQSLEFGQRIKIVDGKEYRIPVVSSLTVLDMSNPDDPMFVTDTDGNRWMIGRINGVLHKRRMG